MRRREKRGRGRLIHETIIARIRLLLQQLDLDDQYAVCFGSVVVETTSDRKLSPKVIHLYV